MSNEDFGHALRSLDAPYLLDGGGTESVLGTEFSATAHDGASVTITRVHDRVVESMRDVDAFIRVLEARTHRVMGDAGVLLGAGVTPRGGVFVVGRRIDGETLSSRLARVGSIPTNDIREIGIRSAALLDEHCASSGCHGLVMPSTLVFDSQGEVRFRWAGLFTALRTAGVSTSDIARLLHFGSYLAPELESGVVESVRSDVFSLGATLYEALTGRPPFGGRTTSTVMAAVLADSGQPSARMTTDVVRSAVLRAIERDPHDRWPDGAHFREALAPTAAVEPTRTVKRRGCGGVAAVAGIAALVLWSVLR
jgi:hypothetical protein